MEYCEGGNLLNELKKSGSFDENQAIKLLT